MALTQVPTAFHSIRLPGWIGLSVAAHLVVLWIAGGGTPPAIATYHPVSLTVEIGRIEPEAKAAAVVPGPVPEIEARQNVPEPIQPPSVNRTAATRTIPLEATAERSSQSEGYLRAHELDVRSEPINEVLLHYPQIPYLRRMGGVVQFADSLIHCFANQSFYFRNLILCCQSRVDFDLNSFIVAVQQDLYSSPISLVTGGAAGGLQSSHLSSEVFLSLTRLLEQLVEIQFVSLHLRLEYRSALGGAIKIRNFVLQSGYRRKFEESWTKTLCRNTKKGYQIASPRFAPSLGITRDPNFDSAQRAMVTSLLDNAIGG